MENRYKYFLFGEEAVRTYMETDIYQLLADAEKEELHYGLFKWDAELHNPEDILEESAGWDDWCIMPEEDFESLNKLK